MDGMGTGNTLIDMNWGGAGYASYEGRLEDEGVGGNEPLDSQERVEAAMAAFSGAGEPDPNAADPNAADPGAAAAADPNAADPNAADPNAAGQLTDDQRNADPVFKELSAFKDAVGEVFDKHGLSEAAEANGRTPQQEADLQLSDANILYKIMRGEGTPSDLLDTMVNVGNWQKAQKDAVAGDLIAWLTKAGYIKDGQAAAGDGKKPAGKEGQQFADPVERRLSALETQRQQEEHQRRQETQKAQDRLIAMERDRVGKVFIDHVGKLCKDGGIGKEDMPFYASQIASLVNGNQDITTRVATGNFVDIKKFFDTVHGRELQRLDRYNKAELARQANKNKNPKISAGGGPAAPSGAAKPKVGNRDDRIAAGVAALLG